MHSDQRLVLLVTVSRFELYRGLKKGSLVAWESCEVLASQQLAPKIKCSALRISGTCKCSTLNTTPFNSSGRLLSQPLGAIKEICSEPSLNMKYLAICWQRSLPSAAFFTLNLKVLNVVYSSVNSGKYTIKHFLTLASFYTSSAMNCQGLNHL